MLFHQNNISKNISWGDDRETFVHSKTPNDLKAICPFKIK